MFNQNRSTPDQIAPGLHLEFNSLAQGNLIAHNYCESPSSLSSRYGVGGLSINQNCTALENTIVGNIIDAGGVSYQYGAGVVITHDTALFYENIIYGNKLENGINPVTQIAQHASSDVSAPNNWFGTTVTSEIDDMIWDFYDDPDNYPGKLLYTPIATGPIAAAPPVLVSISLDPTSPVGAETVEFTLTFSKPMDTSVDPLVTFGITDPFTQHQIDGSWTIP